ncbi:MAG: lactoylglutathione lyase [Acidimicrobiia bacterium]|nr:lactoylglutathione lyase [Acidimicrobiia bacterium]
MSWDDSEKPARRFLHICYCCADTEPVVKFLTDGLKLKNTMTTTPGRSGGAILGIEGEVEGCAAFVYDARGPRTSPALEVQSWIDPKPVGEPMQDPTHVGIHAIGYTVPHLEEAQNRLVGLGYKLVASGKTPFNTQWATLLDPNGVPTDIVADPSIPAEETRLRHMRVTCTDLDKTLLWYEGIGFEVMGTYHMQDAGFLGLPDEVDARVARLRLPDEPFEVLMFQWKSPASHGHHYTEPFHAGLFRCAVGVDDTNEWYNKMLAEGWDFDRAPMLVELTGTPVPDMWICFTSDPDGVPFEFVQRPRSAFR